MDHSESDALEAARARRGDLHRALLDLEGTLASAARGRAQAWADSVRATLVRVRETFTAHIDVTEGADRLYQEVLAHAPRLSGAVNRLQHEHADIASALAEVDSRLDDPMSDADAWVESIRAPPSRSWAFLSVIASAAPIWSTRPTTWRSAVKRDRTRRDECRHGSRRHSRVHARPTDLTDTRFASGREAKEETHLPLR